MVASLFWGFRPKLLTGRPFGDQETLARTFGIATAHHARIALAKRPPIRIRASVLYNGARDCFKTRKVPKNPAFQPRQIAVVKHSLESYRETVMADESGFSVSRMYRFAMVLTIVLFVGSVVGLILHFTMGMFTQRTAMVMTVGTGFWILMFFGYRSDLKAQLARERDPANQ